MLSYAKLRLVSSPPLTAHVEACRAAATAQAPHLHIETTRQRKTSTWLLGVRLEALQGAKKKTSLATRRPLRSSPPPPTARFQCGKGLKGLKFFLRWAPADPIYGLARTLNANFPRREEPRANWNTHANSRAERSSDAFP